MRKLFALLALVLGVVSCQNDPEGFGANVGGEQVTNVTVALPELTRASSTAGAITNVDLTGDYTIRYIFQVYNSDFTESKAQQVKYSDDASVSFPVRLVAGRNYNFVVWADIVKNANPVDGEKCADLHYNTADLANITLNNTWEAMDETRDAYTVSQPINNFKGTEGYTLTLKRPFAKLRVVTTDMAELLGLELENATVTYSTPHYNAFNALESEVVGDSKNRTIKHENYTIKAYAEDSETNKVLFTDYFFAKDEVVKFNMSVAMSDGKSVDRSFTTDIPVKRNYLTTLIGDILTEGNNIVVNVVEGFDNNVTDKPWYVEYFSGVKNETIVLDETGIYIFNNLTINADPAVLVKAPAEAVIDLQGTVSFKGKQGIVVQDGAKLTINGVTETRAAERAGKLIVEATEGSAIGGNFITINNLAGLTAKAGNVEGAFGIGAIDAEVVINNTKIDYVSGAFVQPLCINDPKYGKSEPEGGAAIGGKKVTIDGVELVKAEGGSKSAAIGNRYWQNTEVIIKNSTLGDVFGGNASAAIGGSRYAGDAKHNVKILIENSTITNAVGGQFGAGIGSGYDTHCNQQNFTATNDIVIKNSTITAKGGKYAPGIGTGFHSAYLTGSITESTIVSVAGDEVWYKGEYTTAQNLGYGIVDPAREFQGENANVTFTVDGVVIPSPVVNATYVTVYSAEELQAAFNNAKVGDNLIYIGANIEGNATLEQTEGENIILDGQEFKYDGTITVNGMNRNNGAETVTIKNINFESTTISPFINCPSKINGVDERYSHNVTIDGCTFTAPEYNESVSGISAQKTYHLTVKNCEATNIHSLIQVQSCDNDVTIENVKAINCKNGISVGNTAFPTIKGAEIKVKGYGVRGDADASRGALKLTDMNIEAAFPIAIRKVNTNGYSVALDGTNTLTTSNTYQIVFTSNSDEAVLEDPTGTYTLTGAEGMKVFPVRPAAKVGSTEYMTIDEAIAAWTNNTTLTLLDNVTLSDVVTIKSTEHHILDLGTFTLTAASGKNAFEILACGTGSAERPAITIKADATNPGSINAGSKSIVYYDYSKGGISTEDRPIIKIEGGVFNGATSSYGTVGIYFKGGNAARKAATLNISGGTFNCSIYGQGKSKLIISGGLFHYSVGSQGDSTANRLISGGTFKTFGFMTADSNNTKFWFGTSMANSNVGLYINDDDYLVVGGAPITDFGDKFAAKATNPTKWSSYLQYSSAATNGLYYTNAEMAIKKHGEANVVLK